MAKGRKRKNGSREPSGRISRSLKRELQGAAPTEAVRLRDAALAGMRDAVWSTVAGQMFVRGELRAAQFEAAKRWANLAALYHRAIQARRMKSAFLPVATRGDEEELAPRPIRIEADETERDQTIVSAFNAASSHIVASFGYHALNRMRELCEGLGQTPAGHEAKLVSVDALNCLALYWGISE